MVNPVNPAFRSVTHFRLPFVSFRVKPYGFSLTLHYKMNPVTFRYDTPVVSRFLRLLSMEYPTMFCLQLTTFISADLSSPSTQSYTHARCFPPTSFHRTKTKPNTLFSINYAHNSKNISYLSRHLCCMPTHGVSEIGLTLKLPISHPPKRGSNRSFYAETSA